MQPHIAAFLIVFFVLVQATSWDEVLNQCAPDKAGPDPLFSFDCPFGQMFSREVCLGDEASILMCC